MITFSKGLPTHIDGQAFDPITLIQRISQRGAIHGIGRGIHIGTTVLGVKGRIAFEAPGPYILFEAHRALEKLVLTRQQESLSRVISSQYADGLHNGIFFDPAMRDIETCLDSMQQRVSGEVRVKLFKGSVLAVAARSPHSMLGLGATYGEGSTAFTGAEAAGFCKVYAMESALSSAAGQE